MASVMDTKTNMAEAQPAQRTTDAGLLRGWCGIREGHCFPL